MAPNSIKIKNEGGETRIYLNGVNVGSVVTWCPPASEMNKGARRLAKVTIGGRAYNLDGQYRVDVLKWVRSGEWVSESGLDRHYPPKD